MSAKVVKADKTFMVRSGNSAGYRVVTNARLTHGERVVFDRARGIKDVIRKRCSRR